MRVSGTIPKDDALFQERQAAIKRFLMEVLDGNGANTYWTGDFTMLWVDGRPYKIESGQWQISDGYIYLPRLERGTVRVGSDLQVAILISIAEFWDLQGDEEIKEAVVRALVKVAAELWETAARVLNLAEDTNGRAIQRFALKDGKLAALLGDTWRSVNGEEVEAEGLVEFALEG